ncbi:DHH family phosphoesterase [Jiulongibacter sp. NS-SX5]|uniref:DHH family phosphoesterase n=1 Tax=Jiulongibacter sp. NS-SX5 TaxID=3463854 RepID=UPI0040599A27
MKQLFTENEQLKSEFKQLFGSPQKIVLTAHQNPDGDAYGSIFSLYHVLKNLGHQVYAISPTSHADYIAWMPGVNEVINFEDSLENGRAKRLIKEANVIFCLDFSALDRAKDMHTPIKESKAVKVLIDHHQQPEGFADYVYWDEKAAATCELIFCLLEDLDWLGALDKDGATCLYTGILTDTGSFKFDSTTKRVHRIAGELIDKGINPNQINRRLFDQNSFDRLRFMGYALGEKLTYLPEYRTALFSFTEEEQNKFNLKKGDTEGLVNYGLSIAGAVMSAIFIEKETMVKVSFRSVDDFSVAELSRNHFNGGGHKNAAGGRSTLGLEATVEKFLSLLPEHKEELLKQP